MERHVLVIDDSPEDRETVSIALRQDTEVRYHVHEVADGASGLEKLRSGETRFDLIVLDYRLPDLDAALFVEKLAGVDQTPDTPIIVLTGSMEGRLKETDSLRHGVQDFFTKNEVTAEIIQRIARNAIERHRLLRQLIESERNAEEARIEAERANRAKSQFLTLVSHELRTPLTAVLGFTELLRNNPAADDADEMLRMIASSGEHLADLLNDLIDIAKVEAGTLDVEVAEFNPRELIESTCHLMAIRASDKGIRLTHSLSPFAPDAVCSDPIRVRQVLINLLGNAIKFTDSGEIRCRVDWDRDQETMSVEIEDTGPGIPDTIRETLFTPFVQGSHSGVKREGIGLGLAICHHLARKMGGDLVVVKTGPDGTTFRLDFSAPTPMTPASAGRAAPAAASKQAPDLEGKNFLIVEDTKANRYLLGRLIAETGGETAFATNGKEAVDRLTGPGAESFDLVLMDMMMPVMDGFEATRRIRDAGLSLPIVAITAAVFPEEHQRCLNAGCVGVLTKPICLEKLYEQLTIHLD